jgi:mannan polymerase II complex MNN10 subunit
MQDTEVHVMCDPVVDDLWNKPAFLLHLLIHEMLKPEDERLEWIMWVDRDTLVLDKCRPMSSFLPPEPSPLMEQRQRSKNDSHGTTDNTTHLLVNNDLNGLNNGVFLIRVNSWAIDLFNTILAFRYYKPDVELKFTEQSAMEKVIGNEKFSAHVRTVPQHWFNCYPYGLPEHFRERSNETGLGKEHVRRGDYLLHFAGNTKKDEAINGWLDMLQELPDVWEHKTVQRDVSEEVMNLWERLENLSTGGIQDMVATVPTT